MPVQLSVKDYEYLFAGKKQAISEAIYLRQESKKAKIQGIKSACKRRAERESSKNSSKCIGSTILEQKPDVGDECQDQFQL